MIRGDFKKRTVAKLALTASALALVVSACTGISAEQAQAKDNEIASLKTQIASVQRDATYWKQLTAVMQPVSMKTMSDHRAHMLPSGVVMATHFDNMDLGQAQNLNWVALGVPGRFCKAEQERVEKTYGKGFTHFHDMKADTHGGPPNAEGIWFIHIGARDFQAPWGQVKTGQPDMGFMVTPPPNC